MDKLSSFKNFKTVFEENKTKKIEERKKANLVSSLENYFSGMNELKDLYEKFVSSEDRKEREEIKIQIIEQTKNLKEKENVFKRHIGIEDIKDLEI